MFGAYIGWSIGAATTYVGTGTWPPAIAQYAMDGTLSEASENNRTEFQPEVGIAKRRRRTSVATDLLSFDQLMTFDEYDELRAFYFDTLKNGSLTFTRYHPRSVGGTVQEFQFVEPPKLRSRSHIFATVGINLRKMDSSPAGRVSRTVFEAATTIVDAGWAGYTGVDVFSASALGSGPDGGSQVRVSVNFSAIAVAATAKFYFGKQGLADPYDFRSLTSHLTFGGTDITGDGVTLAYVSDWVDLPEDYDESVGYCCAFELSGAVASYDTSPALSGVDLYYKAATAEAATIDKSGGYTHNAVAGVCSFVSKIEIR